MAVTTQPEVRDWTALLPPYVVILHNDDHNDMGFVVVSLLASVPSLSTDQAMTIMITAHVHGQARVISCPLEQAELYRERLEGRGLTATIEREQ